MDRRLLLALVAPVFVLGSSWLGLNVFPEVTDDAEDHEAGRFFGQIWSDSLVADLVFAGGTLVAAALTYLVAARRRLSLALALGFAMQWLVYYASYMLLVETSVPDQHAWTAFAMVGTWGLPGLLFATLVPVVVARPRIDARAALPTLLAAAVFIVASGAFWLARYPGDDMPAPLAPVWSAAAPTLALGAIVLASLSLDRARGGSFARAALVGVASAAAHVALLALAVALSAREPVSVAQAFEAALGAWVGLVAAALAPVAAAWWERREGAADESPVTT